MRRDEHARVHLLVTYGAPKVSTDRLKNYSSREEKQCINGYRVVMQGEKKWWRPRLGDPVPELPPAPYKHAAIKLMTLRHNSSTEKKWCGFTNGFRFPDGDLHKWTDYYSRTKNEPEIRDATRNGLRISFSKSEEYIAGKLEPGWKLIGHSHSGDVVNLVQNQKMECIITFQGTDGKDDWFANLKVATTSFCGIPNKKLDGDMKVHRGFRSELMINLKSADYIRSVKPKLSSCSKLTVTGHSKGGATAQLFAACANNGERGAGNSDFETLKWW